MRPVVELVDFPLPNHPVARKRLSARLLPLAKMPSSLLLTALVWLPPPPLLPLMCALV